MAEGVWSLTEAEYAAMEQAIAERDERIRQLEAALRWCLDELREVEAYLGPGGSDAYHETLAQHRALLAETEVERD